MKVDRTGDSAFTAEFDTEEELRDEHRSNLSVGGLRLPSSEKVGLQTTVALTLRGPWGGEVALAATVVAELPDAIALAFEGDPDEILRRLLAGAPAAEPRTGAEDSAARVPDGEDSAARAPEASEGRQSVWDRVRGLTQMEKLLLAVKADRTERALLVNDSDPRVLLSLLRNPRLTVDEVVRVAKSSYLTYQIADVIMKTGQWMGGLEVRLALIHNAKTPPAFGLRILPTLPDSEVKAIARGGTSMALKQAALRRLQGKR
ncbi:MAG TPA: hypothetical protein VMT00_03990 [Thermoanaerobaculia bacterium]|nr:hypothetical protein [Thermoanaerobaculia bacterium]